MLRIREIFGLTKVEGDVGLEFEVEGRDLPEAVTGFKTTYDDSLRGESYEYVTDGPVDRDQVALTLMHLESAIHDLGSEVHKSYRTSTHVHINVQELTMAQVFNMVTLYLMFEEYLVKFCGKDREGNLFCLRMTDAEGLIPMVCMHAASGNWQSLVNSDIRYAAINLCALGKFGSLEFRSLEGTDDWNKVKDWVKLLLCLRDYAVTVAQPLDIINRISALGPKGLAQDVFGEMLDVIPLEGSWEEVVFYSMRRIQEIAHCRKWLVDDCKPWFGQVRRSAALRAEDLQAMQYAMPEVQDRVTPAEWLVQDLEEFIDE